MILAAGTRPLPEYELVHLLGRGGFGEVWKATGPGGFDVALKFIRLGDQAGRVEMRSLELMRNIRHPHLLPMFGAWQVGDLLVIAMELADRTLMDRLRQVEEEALEGIPPGELLEYVREAAKGLDYLNEYRHPSAPGMVGIQHKDVKPQNLLLVGGCVKVADFGLAKLLEHTITNASGGLTPAYAAPEFFNTQATRWSDQYCLAVTYCQLRGGRLPFGGNAMQVMAGHITQPPDLTMLPRAERPVVARALAKKPEERWPNCREFAEALAASARPSGGRKAKTATVPPTLRTEKQGKAARKPAGRALLPTRTGPGVSPSPRSRKWALFGVVGLLVLSLSAVLLWAFLGWKDTNAKGPEAGIIQRAVEKERAKRTLEPALRPVEATAQVGPSEVTPTLVVTVAVAVPQMQTYEVYFGGMVERRTRVVTVLRSEAVTLRLDSEDVQVFTADGEPVDPREVPRLLPRPTPVLVSADGKPIDPAQLREVPRGTLVLVSPVLASKLSPVGRERKRGGEGARMPSPLPPPSKDEGEVFSPEALRAPELAKEVTNSIGMKLALIPAGKFLMGSPEDEKDREANEGPQHEVEITKPFYMGVYEVTQAEYENIMSTHPSYFSATGAGKTWLAGQDSSRFPVENVSWNDAVEFCKRLSELPEEKRLGRVYRLPTEAEWEYACRGGAASSKPFQFGDFLSSTQANFDHNLQRTTRVGSYEANAFGLYDMHGNVWEWCADWYDPDYYKHSPRIDPKGPAYGTSRVLRGGSWSSYGRYCRSAYRSDGDPSYRFHDLGFRVVVVPGVRTP